MKKKRYYVFAYEGRPLVQKNNLKRRQYMKDGKTRKFVDHSDAMKHVRDKMGMEFYKQYKNQGGTKPINFLVDVEMTFYVPKQSEPDLDNLPAIVLDALQGVVANKNRVAVVLTDDQLVRRMTATKIVKGDRNYDGEPRTEIRVRRYVL